MDDGEAIRELFLATLGRSPDERELSLALGHRKGDREQYGTGLFRISGGSVRAVRLSGRPLPGLSELVDFQPLGLDGAGTGYFIAWDEQGAQGLYRVAPDSGPEKVLAVGDPFASSTVQSISGEAGIAEDGDVAYAVWLEDGSQHVVWLSGERTKTLPVVGGVGVYSVSREAGVLFEADAGRGGGLYRWTGEAVLPVLLYNRLAPNEEPLRQVDAAAMTSTGEVYAQVRTAGNDFVVLHPGGPMPLLFSAGDTVAVEANFFIQPYNFLVRGTGSGSARVLLGMPGSLFELGPGGPHPLFVLGDRLSSGEAFQGVWTYPPGVENSLGDVYLVSNNSVLLRPTAGRVETIVPAHSLLSDGASLNLRGGLGVNDGGVVVFSADTDQGQGRLELLACTGDSSECPALNPTGGTVEYWQEEEYAVDEQNRVMAFFQMAGGPSGYYLFSNLPPIRTRAAGCSLWREAA